ncbi:MAG TPA: DUF4340 domain-containing protein [Terriglobia bacterium]|nr:DUF4340 domain-containing protein [Terriglobia bacterium]
MRFKSTIILLAVFAALGGYVYFAEIRGKDDQRKLEDAKRKVFQFDGSQIDQIRLVQEGMTVTGVRKNDKDWTISEPAGLEADSGEWETLASHIAGMEREKVVSEDAADLAPFGLSKPLVEISARKKDGETVDILFGDENPLKTLRYAKLSTSKEVFLSPNSLSNFQKSLTDLRNKTVLDLLPEDIDRFTLVEGTKKTIFTRMGEDWMIDAPITGKADSPAITSFLGVVQFARASEFADASIDAKKAGLEPAAYQLSFHDSKAQADRVLAIGKEKGTDTFYARDLSRPAIFVVDKQIPEKVRQPLFEWRDKTIARVERGKIDAVEITRGTEKISLRKAGEDWTFAAGGKAASDSILSMFDILDFERAKDILDAGKPPAASGLEKPRLEVSLMASGKEAARLSFGADSSKPEGVYLKRSDGPVMVVGRDVFDRFNVKAEDLAVKADAPTTEPAAPLK